VRRRTSRCQGRNYFTSCPEELGGGVTEKINEQRKKKKLEKEGRPSFGRIIAARLDPDNLGVQKGEPEGLCEWRSREKTKETQEIATSRMGILRRPSPTGTEKGKQGIVNRDYNLHPIGEEKS